MYLGALIIVAVIVILYYSYRDYGMSKVVITPAVPVVPVTPAAPASPYTHVGCYGDAVARAMSGNIGVVDGATPADRINACYQQAKQNGNKYFGMQFDQYCFIGDSYDKYGPVNTCVNGVGNAWANDVYQVTQPQAGAGTVTSQ